MHPSYAALHSQAKLLVANEKALLKMKTRSAPSVWHLRLWCSTTRTCRQSMCEAMLSRNSVDRAKLLSCWLLTPDHQHESRFVGCALYVMEPRAYLLDEDEVQHAPKVGQWSLLRRWLGKIMIMPRHHTEGLLEPQCFSRLCNRIGPN